MILMPALSSLSQRVSLLCQVWGKRGGRESCAQRQRGEESQTHIGGSGMGGGSPFTNYPLLCFGIIESSHIAAVPRVL